MSEGQKSNRPLAGRTALVTGSGRNIGRGIALAFAKAGANVVVNGHRDAAALEKVAGEIEGLLEREGGTERDVEGRPAQPASIRSCETSSRR